MSNALDKLLNDMTRLAAHAAGGDIAFKPHIYVHELEHAIKEERTSRRELEAFSLLEKYAETPDDKLTDSGLALKRKLLCLGSSSSRQNHGRFNSLEDALTAYKRETGEVVYGTESFDRFARWLYSKKCDDSCPYYRIVEGEGDSRPRCTNPCGVCTNDYHEKKPSEQKVGKPRNPFVGDMVVDAVCNGIRDYLCSNDSKNSAELNNIIKYIKVAWANKKMEDIK